MDTHTPAANCWQRRQRRQMWPYDPNKADEDLSVRQKIAPKDNMSVAHKHLTQ